MPIQTTVMHLLSVFVIAVAGAGVILWALMTPRIRWDRFRIGLALLLLVAPVALIVTLMRIGNSSARMNRLDADLDPAYVASDTTIAVDLSVMDDAAARADAAVALDSAGFSPR